MHEPVMVVALTLAAVVPSILLLLALNTAELRLRGGLHWRSGRAWPPVLMSFFVGVACALPAYWVERGLVKAPWELGNLGAVLLFWLIVAGATEEGCKFVAYHLCPAHACWNQEEYDGILYAAAVALGFATIENVLYVREAGWEVAKLRAVTAVPAHAMFGILMGAGLGVARVRTRVGWSAAGIPLTALALAVGAHGVYDVLASLPSRVALIGISAFLLVLLGVCLRICASARRRSAAFGGQRTALPPPHGSTRLPAMPVVRDPWTAGALGLVPGLGQAYNGELSKSFLFLSIGLLNLLLYWVAHLFVTDAAGALTLLERLGITVAVTPAELERAVEQKRMLEPTLLSLVLMWEAVGAWEAWATARRRWRLPQVHAVRRSFASHGFGASYAMHVFLVFLLVVAPIADVVTGGGAGPTATASEEASADAGGGEAQQDKTDGGDETAAARERREWKLTWVTMPDHVEGWQTRPEGRPEGQTAPHETAPVLPPSGEDGDLAAPRVAPPQQQPASGEAGSYNQYLSYQIRRRHNDMYYFRNVRPTTWAVVHYRIRGDGALLQAELMKFGGGPRSDATRAVEVIRCSAPYQPLPEGARELDVIELFWTLSNQRFTPGSLEEQLSRLPDGRRIRAVH